MQVVQFDRFRDPAEVLQVVDGHDLPKRVRDAVGGHATGRLARSVAEGAIRVPVEATYPLARVRDAAAREARGGKVLLAAA